MSAPATSVAELIEGSARAALEAALPDFLKRQRWFGGKSRAIASAELRRVLRLEGTSGVLTEVRVTYADATSDIYQLPLAIAAAPATAALLRFIITETEAHGGRVMLYDAVADEDFRQALLRGCAASATAGGKSSRLLSAEQSNTSILFGETAIMKLYRRLLPGENPDVEMCRFLSNTAGFANVPGYLGQLRDEDGATLAFLQEFVSNRGDGWEWMTAHLQQTLRGEESAATLDAAGLLGRRTGELHLALASPTDDAAFRVESYAANDLALDAARLHAQVSAALDALKQNMANVPAAWMERAAALLARRGTLLESAHALATASPHRAGRRIRIHGDYHLGQVLRTETDFLIVDFEGEPAKPLAERRRKQSPLRDVAGMLRSFSYAAHASSVELRKTGGATVEVEERAARWQTDATQRFLASYRDTMASHPELLPQGDLERTMLRAFLLEKAQYELLYELNNRPGWLGIPLEGILGLLSEAA